MFHLTTSIIVQIDKEDKERANAILQKLDISMSDLISMTIKQLIMRGEIPFDVSLPQEGHELYSYFTKDSLDRTAKEFSYIEEHPEEYKSYNNTEELKEAPKVFTALFKHKESDIELSFEEESMGTQMIFCFIPFIMNALNNKKVVIIDELDKSLHPYLVEMIVQMFNDPDINKNGTQLIFNTHDTNLLKLNILRRDQIWFTEKDNYSGVSDLYPLSDFSVRKTENVEKGYMLGRYGAVPFIKNDFNLWEEE